jgi:hypothetical protein
MARTLLSRSFSYPRRALALNAVEDGIAPEGRPEVTGLGGELPESCFWYIGRGG